MFFKTTVKVGIYHTQDDFIPIDTYFEPHPEYFALVDGGRRNLGSDTKLCTGNPAVVSLMAANMASYLDTHPGVDVINLSPTDNAGFCECNRCTALDERAADGGTLPLSQRLSRRMSIFYNGVVPRLRATHPQAKVAVGAYQQYTSPPRDPSLLLPAGAGVMLAHFSPACLAHPVNHPTCAANESFRRIIQEWTTRGARDIYLYEYYRKMAWFGLPWPIIHTIKEDIPYFATLGPMRGLFSQATDENGYTHGLNYYVAAKLLWNPAANVDALVAEFFKKYYAESAAPVLRYHEKLEARMAAVSSTAAVDGTAWSDALSVFDLPFMADLQLELDQAAQLAKGVTVVRVGRLQKHLSYSRRLVEGLTLRKTDPVSACQKLTALTVDCRDNRSSWSGIVPWNECAYLARSLDRITGCADVGGFP